MSNTEDSTLNDLAESFRKGVEIKDRKYRLSTYKQCFVGSEAVDFLVASGAAETREDAVQLGKALAQEYHLFEHVTRDHEFKDEQLFYRFIEAGERGSFSKNTDGTSVTWSDFLAPSSGGNHDSLLPTLPTPDFEAISKKDIHAVSQVWPLDEHNATLLNHVHPPDWKDPLPNKGDNTSTYDLVVIGAGAGGLVTSAGAAGVGAKVALIEENLLGGDCLNVGCVPSKSLIHSANLAHTLRGKTHLAEAGLSVNGTVEVDFEKVMERVRRVRSEISHHDSAERFTKELGVEVFIGRGKFTSDKTVEVNGRTLTFKRAVIATGGYPTLIPMDGIKELHDETVSIKSNDNPRPAVMTNETFFNLTSQPKNLVVIGAGVIGLELSQAMQRLGTSVTVLGRSGKVLPKEDEDLSQLVKEQMISDGVTFLLSVDKYVSLSKTGTILDNGLPEMVLEIQEKGSDEITVKELVCDAVLVAAGRRPNVTGMDLEAAGIEYDTKKGLLVNDKLQTTNPRVYGVGDCCSDFKFTHAADFMARAVIRNALFLGKEKMSNLLIPYATFTSPEIASVGLYGRDLDEKGIAYRTIDKPFYDNDRNICDSDRVGLVRFRVDAKTDKILGASIVGSNAGNMIGEVTLAMQSDTGLGALAAVIHPYPTTSEVIRQAGDLYNKTRLTTTVKSLLRGVIKFQR